MMLQGTLVLACAERAQTGESPTRSLVSLNLQVGLRLKLPSPPITTARGAQASQWALWGVC
jgi:hypothetical protein